MSLLTGLTSEYKFGGVVGCSGWLGMHEKFASVGIMDTVHGCCHVLIIFFSLVYHY